MTALLAGCGGGGGSAGDCALGCGGGGGSSEVANLIISGVPTSLANGSADPVSMTVTAVNSSNQVVSGAAVTITADNGGVVIADGTETDDSGEVSATVSIGDDTTPRTITITVTSGSVTRTKSFAVVEGSGGGSPEMVMSLSSQTVTATSPATVTVTLRDASGVAVPSAVVNFGTVGGLGTFSANTALTNTSGQASVALYPASSTTSGADTVTASATVDGTVVTATSGFQITATEVTIASFTSDLGGGTLSAYGQANLTVTLAGTTPGTPVALSIVSLCANKNKATLTPEAQTTTNGTASFTYKDAQCGATDSADTVQVTITGTTTSSSLTIPLASPSASSLGFVSASPETIYLKNSGFTETSTVTFVVKDEAGNALPNQSVVLEPTTLAGGLTMDGGSSAVTKLSDSNGQVTVRINSGTVPTPVRIKATLEGTNISTVSSSLSIAVGLPSQLNFSLSQATINIEGMDYDGTVNNYTIYASDRLGNPVPAGTSINFVTEGGQIESTKQISITDGIGSATVNFRSSSPRPADGRVTVLAYALGEESFLDVNGDNIFTTGSETFQDLGDVFLSRSFSQTYDPVLDQFISLGITGSKACAAVDPVKDPSGLLTLDATIPSVAGTTCDGAWGRAYVRRATETVFSTSTSRLMWYRSGAGVIANVGTAKIDSDCQTFSVVGDSGASGTYFLMGAGKLYNMPSQGSLKFLVSDTNTNRLNPMPAGTAVTVSATSGISVSVSGTPIPSTSSATGASILYKFTDAAAGAISVTTTSPKGVATSYSFDVTTATTPDTGKSQCSQ
ncbi:hypothetical protein ACS5PM_15680 [Ideonella sp. YS5]